jgi:hypothetical protein
MISLETTEKLTFKMQPKAVIDTGLVVHGYGRLPIQIIGDFTDFPKEDHNILMMAMMAAFPQKAANDAPSKPKQSKKKTIVKKLKMLIPRIGTFTNTAYEIKGIMWFGRLNGIVTFTECPQVYEKGKLVDLPEYHLKDDLKPQFYRK